MKACYLGSLAFWIVNSDQIMYNLELVMWIASVMPYLKIKILTCDPKKKVLSRKGKGLIRLVLTITIIGFVIDLDKTSCMPN